MSAPYVLPKFGIAPTLSGAIDSVNRSGDKPNNGQVFTVREHTFNTGDKVVSVHADNTQSNGG